MSKERAQRRGLNAVLGADPAATLSMHLFQADRISRPQEKRRGGVSIVCQFHAEDFAKATSANSGDANNA